MRQCIIVLFIYQKVKKHYLKMFTEILNMKFMRIVNSEDNL